MTLPFLAPFLLWLRALHLIADFAWIAGILYLPRLFVYHCEVPAGSMESERFKVMERRLYKAITLPAMLVAWLFGLLLMMTPGAVDWHAGWWHTKLLMVLLLSGFTGAAGKWRRDFMEDRNRRPARFYRIANEVPTVLMVVIVVMVVVQPF